MNRIKKWVCEHKDNPTFKHTVIIVVLIIIAIGVQIFDNFRTKWENADAEIPAEVTMEEAEEKENAVIEILDNSKAHIILLVITGTALAVVQYKKEHKIRESK
mgnify:CR=1 FL=1